MDKHPAWFYKTLVVGIIILFVGLNVVTSKSYVGKASFIFKSNKPPYTPSSVT